MILHEFYDDQYPLDDEGFVTIRSTVRAIVLNDEGKLGFLHIQGEDYFGLRNHLETIGGGIEAGEDQTTALQREVLEEIGYQCEILGSLGTIIDRYNRIHRITVSHFYWLRITGFKGVHRTAEEELLVQAVRWLTLEEALAYYEQPVSKVNQLVQQRDYFALRAYQQHVQ